MKPDISTELKNCNLYVEEIEAAYHEIAFKLNISDSAMKILYAICENGESCLLRDICRHSGLNKQTVNSALRKLEKKDIIFLVNASTKTKEVFLTDKGKEFVRNTIFRIIEMEDNIFSSWSKEDIETYTRLSKKFANDLKERVKNF